MLMPEKTTNWDLCFICQKVTKESLRSTDDGRKNLSVMLPKFESKNALGFDINRVCCSDEKLLQTLQKNQASYHPSCKNKYNNRMFERELQKKIKQKRIWKTLICKVHHASEDLPF